jgi:hypothetical protein
MAEKFCRKWRLPRHFWVLLHAVKHDMGQTALLPLWRKACWGFFRPKNPTASAGFEPANSGTKGQHATPRPPKPLISEDCHTKFLSLYLVCSHCAFSFLFSYVLLFVSRTFYCQNLPFKDEVTPLQACASPSGPRRLRLPELLDNRPYTLAAFTPQEISLLRGWVNPKTIVRPEGYPNDPTGNRTRDLRACSAVTQLIAPPRASCSTLH